MARKVASNMWNKLHTKCRCKAASPYIRDSDQMRLAVPDDKVDWSVEWPQYDPDDYTMPHVLRAPVWADPVSLDGLKFNSVDGKVNRQSHMGEYKLDDEEDSEGRPLNPVGRTGLQGRGTLGKWGPNHAADPIVTRWRRNTDGTIVTDKKSGKKILQFVAIVRRDHGEWAIPGGMVDAGENVNVTLKREFSEEAMNSLELPADKVKQITEQVDKLFSSGTEVYRGYVDDPRNTDNAWMETVAFNFHDESGASVGAFKLNAGDDAVGVKWKDITKELKLFASHIDFIKRVSEMHDSHW